MACKNYQIHKSAVECVFRVAEKLTEVIESTPSEELTIPTTKLYSKLAFYQKEIIMLQCVTVSCVRKNILYIRERTLFSNTLQCLKCLAFFILSWNLGGFSYKL